MKEKELIKVLQAYEAGKDIEERKIGVDAEWRAFDGFWDTLFKEYRVKTSNIKWSDAVQVKKDGKWIDAIYSSGGISPHGDRTYLHKVMIEGECCRLLDFEECRRRPTLIRLQKDEAITNLASEPVIDYVEGQLCVILGNKKCPIEFE